MLIDTHAHVNFSVFREDGEAVIRRALEEGVWMINVGSDYKTSKRALAIANNYERGVYAAIGLHPIHTADYNDGKEIIPAEDFSYDVFDKLAQFKEVVAIGEIGLDYYRLNMEMEEESKKKQKEVFLKQLKIAAYNKKPVIIHCRQAHDDMLDLLTEFKHEFKNELPKDSPWGVMHCFSGDENLAWKYFSLGLIISFTGLITFSRQYDELIRRLPLDKFMIETDCPFMTPEPYRGQRNEPSYVSQVAKRIAEIKNLSLEKIGQVTTDNARRLFKI